MPAGRRRSKQTTTIMFFISIGLPLLLILWINTLSDSSTMVQASTKTPSPPSQNSPNEESPDRLALKYIQKALKHFERQEFEQSINDCEKALEYDDQLVFAHAVMGQIFNHLNDWAQASDSWRKATALEVDNYEFYYHLGFSLHQVALDTMKKSKKLLLNKEAIQAFKTYLRLVETLDIPQTQLASVHSYLGNVYKSMKTRDKQELAKEHFLLAVNLDPTNELAFFNIGLLYVDEYEKTSNEELRTEALNNINKAIELSPSNTHFSLVRDAILGKVTQDELMMTMQHSEL